MSQREAATRAGITTRQWKRIERGEANPTLESLLGIQYALRIDSLDALFGETTGDLLGRTPSR